MIPLIQRVSSSQCRFTPTRPFRLRFFVAAPASSQPACAVPLLPFKNAIKALGVPICGSILACRNGVALFATSMPKIQKLWMVYPFCPAKLKTLKWPKTAIVPPALPSKPTFLAMALGSHGPDLPHSPPRRCCGPVPGCLCCLGYVLV